MYAVFNESNFNTEVHEMYLDLCSVGTSAIFVEEANEGFIQGGLHFNTLHIAYGDFVVVFSTAIFICLLLLIT